MDTHDITILYHLHQCRSRIPEIYCAKVGKGGIMYLCVWGKTYKTRACADIHCVYTAASILMCLDA